MPFLVQEIIEGKTAPVAIRRYESAKTALELMIQGDYSQLPVVTSDWLIEGIITSDSIVRSLNHLDLTVGELGVDHAIRDVKVVTPDNDLFDLLDDLNDCYAVLVADKDGKLVGIITDFDTTSYFRTRAEDMMLVEDVESSIKEYIRFAFQDEAGEIDENKLEEAIGGITPASNAQFQENFSRSIGDCFRTGAINADTVDQSATRGIFESYFISSAAPKSFDRLTLSEYIQLFLNTDRWHLYKDKFNLEVGTCRKLLDSVRETRNSLAHFRADLTSEERDKLRFCRDLLGKHLNDLEESLLEEIVGDDNTDSGYVRPLDNRKKIIAVDGITHELDELEKDFPPQIIEPESEKENRYTKLATFLQSLGRSRKSIRLPFDSVETIIDANLPRAAREHRSWWANDSEEHVQSRQWLEAGWRVSSVNISLERVTFSRIKGREQQYIAFYSKLISALQQSEPFKSINISPTGRNYMTFERLSADDKQGNLISIGAAFAHNNRFKAELYIDSGDDVINDAIYDGLYEKREIVERSLGENIAWERLENRRASRVAVYHEGSITDDTEELNAYVDWTKEMVLRLHEVFQVKLKDYIIECSRRAGSVSPEEMSIDHS